jgi:WhiB family redox-sensing transcriptional regulator
MADQRHWRLEAACAEVDPELFFPERGDPALAAKRICAGCPVQVECLSFALAVTEPRGVWGGLAAGERRALRRRSGQVDAGSVAVSLRGSDAA